MGECELLIVLFVPGSYHGNDLRPQKTSVFLVRVFPRRLGKALGLNQCEQQNRRPWQRHHAGRLQVVDR
jgi:hypothetical protein